jgi:NAD(P)-dependent dehydrogenase (short-subunit alcohol dehydrogenase family)
MNHPKHILIAGASGAVGEGITRYCLSQGHLVTALVRSSDKQRQLAAALKANTSEAANLTFLINAYETEAQMDALRQQLQSSAPIDIAIASLGGWFHGPQLAHLPLTDWQTVINNSLSSHFRLASIVLPLLEKQGKGNYTMINGGAALYPAPHSGVISVMAAAQKMMGQVFHQEAKTKSVKVYGVAAFTLVETRNSQNMSGLWLSAEDIGKYVLELMESNGEKAAQYWHPLQSPQDLEIQKN